MAPPNPHPTHAPAGLAGADDYALMQGVRDGDSAAYSCLYDRYSAAVYALCLRALRDAGEAEDLLIDIFWEVWDRSQRFDAGRGSPASYLMGLARSRVVDRLRSRKTRKRVAGTGSAEGLDGTADERPSALSPAEAVSVVERRDRVRGAMRTLSAPQRQALEMAFFDSMTHTEVAEALKEPVGTVKSRIRQALIQLRKALGGDP